MLKLELVAHDLQWPQLTITVTRESDLLGRQTVQKKIQYDQAYTEAEVMLHNALRPLIEEVIKRRKR